MKYFKKTIQTHAAETQFNQNNIEKVIRLLDVLSFVFSKSTFKEKVVLKGGTAINLVYTKLRRLSVDIDLDYHGSLEKFEAFADREIILHELDKYMLSGGYEISDKSRSSYALLSRVYAYTATSNNRDHIKIEINFMDRISLYPVITNKINFFDRETTIVTPSFEELFGMKLAALVDRSKSRDLYDTYSLIKKTI